jgi:multiple antibiotic resistance protein
MEHFWYCFIPLFVAVDAIGSLPQFLGLAGGLEEGRRRTLVWQSGLTAWLVGLCFLVAGNRLLKFLDISIADFMVAGGILLFCFSLNDLLSREKAGSPGLREEVGVVPLGVPLIVGPAVLTAGLLLIDEYGLALTALCLTLNILIAGLLLWASGYITRAIGQSGAKILSKLSGLLLAAFAVMMVRKGILQYLAAYALRP